MSTPSFLHSPASAEQETSHEGRVIPLSQTPQLPQSGAANSQGKRRERDYLLALLVLVLAFLSASFLARNSDLWFHLATGRLLANGQFSFGKDPFAYTTEQKYWANHSWLFDLMLYELRKGIGGSGVVVMKALLVTALAGVLLSVRRREQSLLVPAFCTTLALLALNPRLLLQPACLSYFFLGTTFWLLWRPHAASRPANAVRSRLLLLLLFALWVNLDEWFLLGPVLVTLFWLGERWRGERQTPGWLVPVAWAVCLLSPYSYHGFTLPAELSPVTWTSGLRADERFRAVFASPWQVEHWRAAAEGNIAVWAYFLLTVLGLLSFLLSRSARLGWRLVVWLSFAALAAWQAQTIPFFAVVAAPILALNWQDYFVGGASESLPAAKKPLRTSMLALITSYLLVCVLLALIVLNWVGWLTGYSRLERHVAWDVRAEPSLRQAAETLGQWRRLGLLSENDRVFALQPELAHYSAWFCPEVKNFFDHRYPLFAETARDYETLCQALLKPKKQEESEEWKRVLRDRGIRIVILSDPEPDRMRALLRQVGGDRANWTLLDVSGSILIVGWNEGRPAGGFASLAFDAARFAYGKQEEKAHGTLPAVPGRGPAQLPDHRSLYQTLTQLPVQPAWESPMATTCLNFFQASAKERSPAWLLLAVRAARRAVVGNPEDSNAWLRLGQAYVRLYRSTCERSAEGMLPLLTRLRRMQIITALQLALRLDPDLEEAHHDLAELYSELNYLDMALEHRRRERRISARAGRRDGETVEEHASRLQRLERKIAKGEEVIQQRRSQYATGSRALGGEPVQQARLALNLGMARTAADKILSTPGELLGAIGVKMELELLLTLGRTEEARTRLNEKDVIAHKRDLGFVDIPSPTNAAGSALYPIPYRLLLYDWLRILQTAAIGDYGRARHSISTIHAGLAAAHEQSQQRLKSLKNRDETWLGGLLSGPLIYLPACLACMIDQDARERIDLQTGDGVLRGQQADWLVFLGMLALEQRATEEARFVFAAAQKLCEQPSGAAIPFAGGPIADYYLGQLRSQE